jgi:hypothetical protein
MSDYLLGYIIYHRLNIKLLHYTDGTNSICYSQPSIKPLRCMHASVVDLGCTWWKGTEVLGAVSHTRLGIPSHGWNPTLIHSKQSDRFHSFRGMKIIELYACMSVRLLSRSRKGSFLVASWPHRQRSPWSRRSPWGRCRDCNLDYVDPISLRRDDTRALCLWAWTYSPSDM